VRLFKKKRGDIENESEKLLKEKIKYEKLWIDHCNALAEIELMRIQILELTWKLKQFGG